MENKNKSELEIKGSNNKVTNIFKSSATNKKARIMINATRMFAGLSLATIPAGVTYGVVHSQETDEVNSLTNSLKEIKLRASDFDNVLNTATKLFKGGKIDLPTYLEFINKRQLGYNAPGTQSPEAIKIAIKALQELYDEAKANGHKSLMRTWAHQIEILGGTVKR